MNTNEDSDPLEKAIARLFALQKTRKAFLSQPSIRLGGPSFCLFVTAQAALPDQEEETRSTMSWRAAAGDEAISKGQRRDRFVAPLLAMTGQGGRHIFALWVGQGRSLPRRNGDSGATVRRSLAVGRSPGIPIPGRWCSCLSCLRAGEATAREICHFDQWEKSCLERDGKDFSLRSK